MTAAFDTVADYLEHYARTTPDAVLIRHHDRVVTYADAAEQAHRLAGSMLAHGVRRGDRIAVYGNPHAEVLLIFLAASSIGAIFVGINPKQTEAEIGYVLDTAKPTHLFMLGTFDGAHVQKLTTAPLPRTRVVLGDTNLPGAVAYEKYIAQNWVDSGQYSTARAAITSEAPVAMVFTSGSTGKAKGALLTNGPMMRSYSAQASHWYGDGEPPQGVADLPIHHLGFIADNCMAILPARGRRQRAGQVVPGGSP